MFKNVKIVLVNALRQLRGENLEAITKQNNKQNEKLKLVVDRLGETSKAHLEHSEALILASQVATANAKETKMEQAKAAAMHRKLSSLYTVSPDEIQKSLLELK